MAVPGWLIVTLLIVETMAFAQFNRLFFATWITPFNVLAIPFVTITVCTFLFSGPLGFVPLQPAAMLAGIIGLLLFFLGGFPVALFAGRKVRRHLYLYNGQPPRYLRLSLRIALVLAWICIALLAFRFITIGGFSAMGDEVMFSALYGGGLYGRAMTLVYLLVTFFIGILSARQWFSWLTTILLVVLLTLYTVKSWIFMPLIAGLIMRMLIGRLRLTPLKVVGLAGVCVALFMATYLIGFALQTPESIFDPSTYYFLARHIASYLFSGVLAWSELVSTSRTLPSSDPSYVFAPFLNLYAAATAGRISGEISNWFMVIDMETLGDSNVHTLFGTLSIYLGYGWAALYTLVTSLILYLLFVLAIVKRNGWLTASWSFLAAGLFFGWFDLYFIHLTFLEVTAYGIMIAFFVWLLGQPHRPATRPSPIAPEQTAPTTR